MPGPEMYDARAGDVYCQGRKCFRYRAGARARKDQHIQTAHREGFGEGNYR